MEHFITKVCECPKKPNKPTCAPLTPIWTTYLFELVSIDFFLWISASMVMSISWWSWIISRGLHRLMLQGTKKVKTVADIIFNDFALKFSFPAKLHYDMGKEFDNKLMARLKDLSGIQGSYMTPYHPQGNGQVERFSRTLLSMLRTLEDKEKEDWKESLTKVVHAYNCTKKEATGYAPYYLIFGQSPRLPINLLFGIKRDEAHETYEDYVSH